GRRHRVLDDDDESVVLGVDRCHAALLRSPARPGASLDAAGLSVHWPPAMPLRIETLTGDALRPVLPALARLRTEVFRQWPYCYDGAAADEQAYLGRYVRSPRAAIVLAWDGDAPVGASTCLPLEDEIEDIRAPFAARGLDPSRFFYFGECVLLRGRPRPERHAAAGGLRAPRCVLAAPRLHALPATVLRDGVARGRRRGRGEQPPELLDQAASRRPPAMTALCLALAQYQVTRPVGVTGFAAKLDGLLEQARGAELIVLPEYACLDSVVADTVAAELDAACAQADAMIDAMRAAALRHRVWLAPGSLPVREAG